MSGVGNIGPFSEEEVEARHKHIKTFTLSRFAYSPKGCTEARAYLEEKGVDIHPGLSGWEIVLFENKEFQKELL